MKTHDGTRREFVRTTAKGLGAAFVLTKTAALGSACARKPDRTIGFAVAGVGRLTTTQVAPALRKTKHARLTGVISGSPAKAMALAEAYDVPPSNIYDYESMQRLGENPDIQVVYVATPNGLHRDHTVEAARAGKHVLCEKPMAVSVSECEEMIGECAAAGVKLAIGYRCQFEAHHLECMRLAREKEFGEVKLIESGFGFRLTRGWRLQKDLAGGGALMDAGIYAIQACRYVSGGEPVEVSAFEETTEPAVYAEVDESITWQMRFPNGILASCATSYNVQRMNRMRVYGETGWFGLERAFAYDGLKGSRSDGEPLRLKHVNHFATELDDFALCILEDRDSRVAGEEGKRDLVVIEAIYESIREGRPISLA
jgi:predicted dehydrogenase